MLCGWLAWIYFLHGIHNTLSGEPPVIRYFVPYDLTLPGEVPWKSGFRLPCKASGTSPLEYTWKHNGRDIVYGDQYRLLSSGALEGFNLNYTNNGTYQCFVKNKFGQDFSRKIKVLVTVAGEFHYADDKIAPVTLGKPIEIPCPSHEPSFGVAYRWGMLNSARDTFLPFEEDKRIALTLDGTLVFMYVTIRDVIKVNSTGGILCEMSTGSETKYSHSVYFRVIANASIGVFAPSMYFAPKPQEEAREGYEKKLYCLAVGRPEPYIIWKKDGEEIEHEDDGYYLPSKYHNRVLVIDKVTQEHQGSYTCTGDSTSGSFAMVSRITFLTVKASPKWRVELPANTSVARTETTSLTCLATGMPRPRYSWFRNGREINVSGSQVKLQDNILILTNVKSWHEAVFQCVAENDQGMIVTSTWVHVEDPSTVSPSSQKGDDSQKLLWIIIIAVLGVLLIVTIIVIIVCVKRRKTREREERPRATEEASHYNDICDDMQSNPSLQNAAPHRVTDRNGIKRRPTLPPIPQYQTLAPPTTTGNIPSYEPLDAEHDLNDSGLYETLDFRTMNNGPEYDNPEKPIPEYLELVNDTAAQPGNIAPPAKTGGPGKEYVPMEGGLLDNVSPNYVPMETPNDVFDNNNSSPNYVPMETGASNVNNTAQSSPSPPRYELMTGKVEPSVQTKGSSSPDEYYQPMADKTGLNERGEPGSSPPEYYVPMAEQILSEPVVQTRKTLPKSSEGIEDRGSTKL